MARLSLASRTAVATSSPVLVPSPALPPFRRRALHATSETVCTTFDRHPACEPTSSAWCSLDHLFPPVPLFVCPHRFESAPRSTHRSLSHSCSSSRLRPSAVPLVLGTPDAPSTSPPRPSLGRPHLPLPYLQERSQWRYIDSSNLLHSGASCAYLNAVAICVYLNSTLNSPSCISCCNSVEKSTLFRVTSTSIV